MTYRYDVLANANVVNSLLLNRIKQNDDGSLKPEASIASRGSGDSIKDVPYNNCKIFCPTEPKFVEWIISLLK